MIEISIRQHAGKLERALLRVSSELREEATKRVIGRTAALVRQEVIKELPTVFDRPTPWTLKSIRFQATDEEATIYVSDDTAKGIAAQKFLRAEIMGGERNDKRSEKALQARGLLPSGDQVVPGNSQLLDQYGNLRAGLVTQALSGVGAMREAGYTANATARSRDRWTKRGLAHKRTGTPFFIGRSKSSGVEAIYQIMGRHKIRAVMRFIPKPHYARKFDLHAAVAKHAGKIFPVQIRRVFHEIREGSLHE